MTESRTSLAIELPVPEAADIATRAASEGVSMPTYLGYLVLKAIYGYQSSIVVAFESRPKFGQERKT